MNDQNKHETSKLIEMPEGWVNRLESGLSGTALRATDESTDGLYGNGVVTIDKGPGIPVENPGPQAIRRAGTPLGGDSYMIPRSPADTEKE